MVSIVKKQKMHFMLPIAKRIVKKLVSKGRTAYFAGGWVRDFLMHHPSDDIDIATSASTEEIQKWFPKTIAVGIAFGIVIVVEEGHHFEVATFRKDKGYVDGRRPTGIDSATPKEDAERRDFTINGMFYDPIEERVYDYVGGKEDLKKGIIRAIGSPHARFLEDRLRMMRAVRYATRFNFTIEPATLNAILEHAPSLFPSVAIERVWQEFEKMSKFGHFEKSLRLLYRLNLLQTIFPELKILSSEEIEKKLLPLTHYPQKVPTLAELLELFPDDSLQTIEALCSYLKLPKKEKEFAYFLHHAKNLLRMPKNWQSLLQPLEWAEFYANSHSLLALQIIAARFKKEDRLLFLQEHKEHSHLLKKAIERIRSKSPVVNSEHLKKEGILPGKKMGILLKEAEKICVNEGLDDPDKIIARLKSLGLWD